MIARFILAIWIGGGLLEAAVGGAMLRRRLVREYPLFFAYITGQLLKCVVMIPIYLKHDRVLYMQAFAVFEALDAGLSFAVIYELFRITFRDYSGIRELGWMLLRWSVVVLMAVAVITAASAPATDANPLLAALFAMERSVSVLRGGLLFLLFIFHSSLGLRWAKMSLGIAIGFASVTAVGLITYSLRTHFGPSVTPAMSLIQTAAYDCALLEWLYVALQPKTERLATRELGKWDVEGWNQALVELLHR
jgi:hypothetical protein